MTASPRRTRSGRVFNALAQHQPASTPSPPVAQNQPVRNNNEQQENLPPRTRSLGSYTIRTLQPDLLPGDHDSLFAISFQNFGPENPARVVLLNDEAFNNLQTRSTTTGVSFSQPYSVPAYPYMNFHGTVFRSLTNHAPPQPCMNSFRPSVPPLKVKCPDAAALARDARAVPGASTCIICLDNTPICMAFPCNHLSYCVACVRTLSLSEGRPKHFGQVPCPKCRTQVESFERCVFE